MLSSLANLCHEKIHLQTRVKFGISTYRARIESLTAAAYFSVLFNVGIVPLYRTEIDAAMANGSNWPPAS
jgi:hypothetical protein